MIGDFHTYYRELVAELGLTIGPSFPDLPGQSTWLMRDGRWLGEDMPWMSADDHAIYERLDRKFATLARTVDPEDPWSHPNALALDQMSFGEWLRREGASPQVIRAFEVRIFALGDAAVNRRSLLAELRQGSTAGGHGFYDYDVWENLKVLEGSATVALRMAEQLDYRIRDSTPIEEIAINAHVSSVRSVNGEVLLGSHVVCAIPSGPLRDIRISGVSKERLAALHRLQHSPTVKYVPVYPTSFWEENGQNGTGYFESTLLGGTWVQAHGVLSALVPVDRLGAFQALPSHRRSEVFRAQLVSAYGPEAGEPESEYIRNWAGDPWTQGYSQSLRPGELTSIGPLHGSHEPPFWIVGSDQWVSGYMEGAVCTGRQAAAAIVNY